MANELGIGEGFLNNQLALDSVLTNPLDPAYVQGFFSVKATRGFQGKYITWTFQGSPDVYGMGANRIATEPLFLVTVHGRTRTFKDLEAAANRIDVRLDRQNGVYNGFRIAACIRESPYQMVDDSEPAEWRRLGGYYRLYIVAS